MNLRINELKVYTWLCHHDERPPLKDIGERIGMTPMQMTRAIKGLEDFGVITCERQGGDKNFVVPESIEVSIPPDDLKDKIIAGVLAELPNMEDLC